MLNFRSLLVSAGLVGLTGCPGDDSGGAAPPVGTATGGTVTVTASNTNATPTGSTSDTDTDSSSGSGTADTTGVTPTNCGQLQCSDNGSCVIDESGSAFCLCDGGYVFDEVEQTCVVDETCIQVSFLENGCRQKVAAEPAVALFFALDFCAGTAVTPEKYDELGLSFVVRENGVDINDNVESDATILDAEVESYVTLVVDVSNSVTESEDLPALVTELRALVSSLEADPGDPDVYVSVYVFGREVAEYVPFTRDLGAVDSALGALADDPAPVVALASGGESTALFKATAEGIEETRRIRELRDAVTWGGVLTTGTVVVVTDGLDSSNGDLDTGLIAETTNQVISIGISTDIDDEELRTIGRDGSFLAPTPQQWTTAFASIAQRVDEYPERSYLLAYCSSASEGTPDVEVGVGGASLVQVDFSECRFNAELFSSQGFACSSDFFVNECNAVECGGLTGCGACPDSECCDGTQCVGTVGANDTGIDCENQIHTCEPSNLTCDVTPAANCVNPVGDGAPCGPGLDEDRCTFGVDFCGPDPDDPKGPNRVCIDTLPIGSPCDVPEECASLNCYFPNPENPFEGRRCLPEARIGDHCGPDDAICESGAYCQGGECRAKEIELASCSANEQCRRGICQDFDVGGNFCVGPAACYWTWDQKVPN